MVNQWQQESLQYLVDKYQCLDSHKDYLTSDRSTFAVEVQNYLQNIKTIDLEDVPIKDRLTRDFAKELLDLNQQITELETTQFSVTTKLTGEVIYQFSDSFSKQYQDPVFWGYRTRINFNTSFTGKDLLKIRLEVSNLGRLDRITGTNLTRLSIDGSSEGNFEIDVIYEFFWGDRTQIIISPRGGVKSSIW